MPNSILVREDVRRIRCNLNLSQEELSQLLDVSPDTVKKWESGARKCSGPARLLMQLLNRSPNVLSLLDEEPSSLPSCQAVDGSPEWFLFQRLLGIIEYFGRGVEEFAEVADEERLTPEWLREQECAGLLKPHDRNYEIKEPTAIAVRRFRVTTWFYWVNAQGFRDSRKIPPLDPKQLETYARLNALGIEPCRAQTMESTRSEEVEAAERAREERLAKVVAAAHHSGKR